MSKKPNPTKVDRDNPEWTRTDFRRARPASEVLPADLVAILPKRKRGERGPQKSPTKEQVTLRLDSEVLAAFKEEGPGWQTRISDTLKLATNEVEAANRAEVTALLIRSHYRVYRPEADCNGEDLVIRTSDGELRGVQLKARPTVDWRRYGRRSLWMLFPDPQTMGTKGGGKWFLVPHDELYEWVRERHQQASKWNEVWSFPRLSRELGVFLADFTVN